MGWRNSSARTRGDVPPFLDVVLSRLQKQRKKLFDAGGILNLGKYRNHCPPEIRMRGGRGVRCFFP